MSTGEGASGSECAPALHQQGSAPVTTNRNWAQIAGFANHGGRAYNKSGGCFDVSEGKLGMSRREAVYLGPQNPPSNLPGEDPWSGGCGHGGCEFYS